MKKDAVLGIVFFGTLWGLSEAAIGGTLYAGRVAHASVPLSVVGFVVLTFGRAYFPQTGTSTAIACVAMLYKFLNTPFFACHLLAIFLLGLSYDAVFGLLQKRNKAICAAAATYLGYALFAFAITYAFRYRYWAAGGIVKVMRHIGLEGTMAALGNALLVPLAFRLAGRLQQKTASAPIFSARWVAGGISLITAALWILAATPHFQ